MADRLEAKIEALRRRHDRTTAAGRKAFDRDVNESLDMQEVLTAALLPVTSTLRMAITGSLLRDSKERERKRDAEVAEKERKAREDALVPIEVHGGGKCKITIMMRKVDVERQMRG